MLSAKWHNLIAAIRTIGYMWRQETTFRIQVVAAFLVIGLAYALHISYIEWLVVILVIGAVFAVEVLNTAIEDTCDFIIAEHHPQIGIIKDLGALASVFIGLAALIIGIVIFVPKILALL